MGCSGGSWGALIEKLDERMRECSRSGGDCNIKFAFPVKLDRGSPIQGFGLKFWRMRSPSVHSKDRNKTRTKCNQN